MADKKTTTRSFYEVILSGPHDLVHGCLTGLWLGAGLEHGPIFGHEEAVEGPSLGEKLKELIHVHGHECHLILDAPLRAVLKKNARMLFAESGVALVSERRIKQAAFDFEYKVYAPRYDREIQSVLGRLPAGAKLTDHRREERIDSKAEGVEAYSPAHDFEVSGEGIVRGRFDHVVAARHILDKHPLIDAGLIDLELA
jgi:hypothetical protein